ncbi:MAG: hypothetical protein F2911_09865 [Actinobacteria bacterium]|nr:hypothetical protein [Actinomycetota bacterium]MSW36863.1 hypothetical protein [Actinomycetota bacterium]MSX38903.1 hypothetical protein [Actinomycetota bacterium]
MSARWSSTATDHSADQDNLTLGLLEVARSSHIEMVKHRPRRGWVLPSRENVTVSSHLRKVVSGVADFERENLAWRLPVVVATSTLALMLICVWLDHVAYAIPLGAGALFVPVVGMHAPLPRRILTQLWTLMWIMLGTLAGGLVSSDQVLVSTLGVLLAGVFGFGCGFVGAAGTTARLLGVLTLVVFVVFMGGPDTPLGALEVAVVLGLGGLVQVVVITLARLRSEPLRTWVFVPVESSLISRLRAGWSTRNDYLRHGVRLGLAIMAATALSQALSWPHQFWIPMTVAWVSAPDNTGTATRVAARMLGTLGGIAIVAAVLGWQPVSPYGVAVLAGLGALMTIVFFPVQYGLAVVGVTVFVASLLSLLGDPLSATETYRVLETFIACVVTVAFAFVWRALPVGDVRRGQPGNDPSLVPPG